MRAVIAKVSALLALLLSSSANAEDSAAEKLFRQGREAITNGENEKGCALLAESDRLEPSPGAKLGVGLCEEQLGHFARAWVLLHQVIRALPATDERASIALRHSAEIEPKLAFVTVELSGPPVPGTRVASDIAELTSADLGVPLPFDPGSHFFQVQTPGRKARQVSWTLKPGEHVHIALSAEPLPANSAPAPRAILVPLPKSEPRSPLQTAGIALGGASVVFFATSLATGVLAMEAKNNMDNACDADGCSEAGVRAAARGDVLASTSTATFISALASGGLGVLFFALDALKNPHRPPALGTRNLAVRF